MATTISRGLNIKGTLTADEPVIIAGSLNGDVLVANHAVTVGTGGRVDGAVTARVITVQGGTIGRLIARDVVRGTGRRDGQCRRRVAEAGAGRGRGVQRQGRWRGPGGSRGPRGRVPQPHQPGRAWRASAVSA